MIKILAAAWKRRWVHAYSAKVKMKVKMSLAGKPVCVSGGGRASRSTGITVTERHCGLITAGAGHRLTMEEMHSWYCRKNLSIKASREHSIIYQMHLHLGHLADTPTAETTMQGNSQLVRSGVRVKCLALGTHLLRSALKLDLLNLGNQTEPCVCVVM